MFMLEMFGANEYIFLGVFLVRPTVKRTAIKKFQ